MKKVRIINNKGKGLTKNIGGINVNGSPAEINIVNGDPTMLALVTDIFKVTGNDLREETYYAALDLISAHGYDIIETKELMLRLTINGGGRDVVGENQPWGSIIVEAPTLELAIKILGEFQNLAIVGGSEKPPTNDVISTSVELIKKLHLVSIGTLEWSLREEDPMDFL